jgi:hypothetical protein
MTPGRAALAQRAKRVHCDSGVKVARWAKRSRFERSVKADRRSPEGPRLESRATIPGHRIIDPCHSFHRHHEFTKDEGRKPQLGHWGWTFDVEIIPSLNAQLSTSNRRRASSARPARPPVWLRPPVRPGLPRRPGSPLATPTSLCRGASMQVVGLGKQLCDRLRLCGIAVSGFSNREGSDFGDGGWSAMRLVFWALCLSVAIQLADDSSAIEG